MAVIRHLSRRNHGNVVVNQGATPEEIENIITNAVK